MICPELFPASPGAELRGISVSTTFSIKLGQIRLITRTMIDRPSDRKSFEIIVFDPVGRPSWSE